MSKCLGHLLEGASCTVELGDRRLWEEAGRAEDGGLQLGVVLGAQAQEKGKERNLGSQHERPGQKEGAEEHGR